MYDQIHIKYIHIRATLDFKAGFPKLVCTLSYRVKLRGPPEKQPQATHGVCVPIRVSYQ
jgi:hypothetical protein